MKPFLFSASLILSIVSFAQDKKTITYRQWQDMPQDTYVRIMHTADSLLKAYNSEPFDFERKDGSCCLSGLQVIKAFYQKALNEKDDEDAKSKIKQLDDMIVDEFLLFEENNIKPIIQRGDVYFDKGFYKKSLLFYERAYKLDPESKSIKKKLKIAQKRAKKYELT